jgi:hypothetical protein
MGTHWEQQMSITETYPNSPPFSSKLVTRQTMHSLTNPLSFFLLTNPLSFFLVKTRDQGKGFDNATLTSSPHPPSHKGKKR